MWFSTATSLSLIKATEEATATTTVKTTTKNTTTATTMNNPTATNTTTMAAPVAATTINPTTTATTTGTLGIDNPLVIIVVEPPTKAATPSVLDRLLTALRSPLMTATL